MALTEQQQELYAKKLRIRQLGSSEDFAFWVDTVVQPLLDRLFTQITTANVITDDGKNAAYTGIVEYQALKKLAIDSFEMNRREVEQMAQQLEG